MKLCYIISTCDKYINTRVKYQMETYLKHVNKEDIFYLTSKPDEIKRQFGWNCMDDEKNITWKYIHFIYNMKSILNYDWYIFIDDDTFVFIDKLKNLLQNYNSTENFYIGYELDHIKNEYCLYMSGGAGYAISNSLYNILYNYVKTSGINDSFKHWCDDLCIGMWIDELSKKININRIHNPKFLVSHFTDIKQLNDAITCHQISSMEENEYCYNLSKNNTLEMALKKESVFVIVTDNNYFNKAKRTIIDLRSKGNWSEDIVVITIDFKLNNNFKNFYNIIEVQFNPIDKSELLNKIGVNGFSNSDKREITKLNQWEKLHVFDDYFMRWNRVVFLDAGLRVLDDVKYLLDLDYKGKILAPKDGKFYENQTFKCQLSYDNHELIEKVKIDFGEDILNETYFLNCIWIYDTHILNVCNKKQMIEAMNNYTLCRTNEMGIMNLLLRFKYNLWEPFPFKLGSGKILFDWCELNNPNTNWMDYCYIKYPTTISFNDC
jgi:hypothetical protein